MWGEFLSELQKKLQSQLLILQFAHDNIHVSCLETHPTMMLRAHTTECTGTLCQITENQSSPC